MLGRADVNAAILSITIAGASLLGMAGKAFPQEDDLPQKSAADSFGGLAQAPEASLFVGAATTSIPIVVPPGRANMTPKLALAYTSGRGPSPYGQGWDLPIGRVQRCGKRGVLPCNDPAIRNEFVVYLPQATIECTLATSGSVRACTPKIEESFLRIEYLPTDNKWQVFDKGGTKYSFGGTVPSRTGSYTGGLWLDGPPCKYAQAWELTEVFDQNGNNLNVVYEQIAGVPYPTQVLYGGNLTAPLGHQFEVSFTWQDRPDDVLNAIGGFPSRLTRVLDYVEVKRPVGGARVRVYDFDYEFDAAGAPPRHGRQSLLSSVTLYDGQGSGFGLALTRADGLPASSTFSYMPTTPGLDRRQSETVPEWVANESAVTRWALRRTMGVSGDNDSNVIVANDVRDMNGDGFLDQVRVSGCPASNPQWKVFLGGPDGFALTPIFWSLPAGTTCGVAHRKKSDSGDVDTWYDTLDMNGDTIPDLLDARQLPWKVHYGHRPSGTLGWGFDAVAVQWGGALPPYTKLRATDTTRDWLDMVDLNGDSLPDLVDARLRRIYHNTGAGFANPVIFSFADDQYTNPNNPFIRDSEDDSGHTILRTALYDLNGDGLLDQVRAYSTDWLVYMNHGFEFSGSAETWHVPETCTDGIMLSDSLHEVKRDLIDVNADGLPDVVDACGWTTGSPNWRVYLNNGAGFAQSGLLWPAPLQRIRYQPSGPAGQVVYEDTIDLNGDGFVEFVDMSPLSDSPLGIIGSDGYAMDYYDIHQSSWAGWYPACVASFCFPGPLPESLYNTSVPHPSGVPRPDLMTQMENGIGSATKLYYRVSNAWDNTAPDGSPGLPFNVWTLHKLVTDDGLCNDSGVCVGPPEAAHSTQTEIRYAYGFYDAPTREFRGFGTIEEIGPTGTIRTTQFHQDQARKGKQLGVFMYDGTYSKPLSRTLFYWDCAAPNNAGPIPCPDNVVSPLWVHSTMTSSSSYSNYSTSGAKSLVTQNAGWHACAGKIYGNVSMQIVSGADSPTVVTHTDYACTNQSGYVVDKPIRVATVDFASAATVDEKWFFYDGDPDHGDITKGNVTRVESWLDASPLQLLGEACSAATSKKCVKTSMERDAYGNVTTSTNPNNGVTETLYDGMKIYPTVTKHPALAGGTQHRVATEYDPDCGALEWQTSVYVSGSPSTKPRRQFRYDSFCRLQRTALEDEDINTSPHEIFVYKLGARGQPSVYKKLMREPHHACWSCPASDGLPSGDVAYLPSWTLTDALGRVIQTQTDRVVQPTGASAATLQTVAAGTTYYDNRGNVAATYAPFIGATQGVYTIPGTVGRTEFTYDALGRATQTRKPDGSVDTADHITVAFQATIKDACFAAPTAACPGSKTVETRDAGGRVILTQAYEQSTLKSQTQYFYDAMGRQVRTRQWDGSALNPATDVVSTYDSLGRRTTMTDPDSGTWTYGYDKAGNLRFRDDPVSADPTRHRHIQYCYDALNRMTKKRFLDTDFGPTTMLDCAATANETYVYDYTGGGSFGLGRLRSVDDASGITLMSYDVRGRVTHTEKTVEWNGEEEWAHFDYAYDKADHLKTITYPDYEMVAVGYDISGQVSRLDSNVGSTIYLGQLTYDEFGRPRVIAHGLSQSAVAAIDEHRYYGPGGNFRLESIVTKKGSVPALDLHYKTYSARGQLTELADRLHGAGVLSNSATYQYDGLGRLRNAAGVNLSGQTYQHSALGNLVVKEGKGLGYAAGAGAPMRPHQVKVYDGNTDLGHDNSGNRDRKLGHEYEFDHEDRLIDVDNGLLHMVYDYSGARAVKIADDTVVTRYFGGLAESTNGVLTKYYLAGNLRIASRDNTEWSTIAKGPNTPLVMIARTLASQPTVSLLLRDELGRGLPIAFAGLVVGLLLLPGRHRRPVVGIRLRPGPVTVVILLWLLGTLPVPLVLKPLGPRSAAAGGSGGGSSPPLAIVIHFHLDRLGSTQAVTVNGDVLQYIRYNPYGFVRGRYYGNEAPTPDGVQWAKYEFTGYENDVTTGLYYARARFYDPQLGSFLTHDPARQYASPYSYAGGDPVNFVDPTGTVGDPVSAGIIIAAVIGAAIGGAVSAAQAAASGAPKSEIAAAAAQGAAYGALTGAGLGIVGAVGQAAIGPVFNQVLAVALAPYSTYSTVNAFQSGQNVAGAVGVVMLAFNLYEIANGGAGNTPGTGDPQQQVAGNPAPSAQPASASTVGTVGRFARETLGRIWNLPNTVLGTAYGILGIPTEGIGFEYGQLQFKGNLLQWVLSGGGNGAITLGDAGVYPPSFGPETTQFASGLPLGLEESFHSIQGRILGPFYLPAHIAFGSSATIGNGYWHGPINLLEQGPHPANYGSSPTVF